MKLLVMSDSHGAENRIARAIQDNPDAQVLIYLGDGERDFEEALAECDIFPYGSKIKDIYQVCGNCDMFSKLAETVTGEFGRNRMLITHGYAQHVKYDLDRLAREAKDKNCSVALYGHTHREHMSNENGVICFNPGSIRVGMYGVIMIDTDGKMDFTWKKAKLFA